MWKSMKNWAWEWCLSLCVFWFEASCAFGKMWAGCFSVARTKSKANPLVPLISKKYCKMKHNYVRRNSLWHAPAWDGHLCKWAELHQGNTCCTLKLKWFILHTYVIVIAIIKEKCWKKVCNTYSAKKNFVSWASYQTQCSFKANFKHKLRRLLDNPTFQRKKCFTVLANSCEELLNFWNIYPNIFVTF